MSNPFWSVQNIYENGFWEPGQNEHILMWCPPTHHRGPYEGLVDKVEEILAEYFIGHPEEKIPETQEGARAFLDSHPELRKKIEDKLKEVKP